MAFFGVNFILQKFCPCKKNDKYKVWQFPVEIDFDHSLFKIFELPAFLLDLASFLFPCPTLQKTRSSEMNIAPLIKQSSYFYVFFLDQWSSRTIGQKFVMTCIYPEMLKAHSTETFKVSSLSGYLIFWLTRNVLFTTSMYIWQCLRCWGELCALCQQNSDAS